MIPWRFPNNRLHFLAKEHGTRGWWRLVLPRGVCSPKNTTLSVEEEFEEGLFPGTQGVGPGWGHRGDSPHLGEEGFGSTPMQECAWGSRHSHHDNPGAKQATQHQPTEKPPLLGPGHAPPRVDPTGRDSEARQSMRGHREGPRKQEGATWLLPDSTSKGQRCFQKHHPPPLPFTFQCQMCYELVSVLKMVSCTGKRSTHICRKDKWICS